MFTNGGTIAAGVTDVEAIEATDSPFTLSALTVNVYAVPLSSPEILSGEVAPVPVTPLLAVIRYPVIAEPPLLAGAVNETTAPPSNGAADTAVGAFGTVEGITALEADEASEVPIPFVAVTLNV